jgi:hypothetical protein
MTFLQIVSQPALAPFAKFPYIIREIAKMMDLDPEKVVNSPEEAARQAEIMKAMGGTEKPQGAPAGVDVTDPSGVGGGNSGVGSVPTPGEPAFSGPTPPMNI